MMLQGTELCLIVVTISSFNQEGLHLGLGAEAFLINALIESPDDKINSLIIDPSKVIFSRLRIAWCTSTNLQSGRSASFSWKRWFAKLWSVRIFVSVSFVTFSRCCAPTAAILVPWGPFLERPGNFSGPQSNIQVEIKRVRARVLAKTLLHFISLTDSFIMLDAKLLKARSLM